MRRVLSGSLMVAGTAIGAGMLALPVVTAEGGFWPALFMYFLCCAFMTTTGLILLELCLKMPAGANLVSISEKYLGKPGKVVAWGLYLFLFYCLSVAYIAGGSAMVRALIGGNLALVQAGFTFVFGCIVYFGARLVSRVNFALMMVLIGTYIGFAILGVSAVDGSKLDGANWGISFLALPVIFTSFSYQGLIPSLVSFMHRDIKKLRLSIVLGMVFTFLIYVVWEWLILGIVPQEELTLAKAAGESAILPLMRHVGSHAIVRLGQIFAFTALTTSLMGVSLGLMHFLSDGLQVSERGKSKLALAGLTFVPPFLIALSNPNLFLAALGVAGGIGCALLLGLLPVLMAWQSSKHRVGLFFLILFVLFELVMEFAPRI